MPPKKDPAAPTKPKGAFFAFCDDRREDIKKKFPDKKGKDVQKLLSEEWKDLKEDDKKKYQEAAKKEMDAYKEKMKEYNANKSSEEEESEEEKPKKKRGTKRKRTKDPDAPKRPLSGYMLFCQDKREETKKEHPNLKITEISKHLAAKWKDLDDEEKAVYNDRAKANKAKYQKEKEDYDKKAARKSKSKDDDDDEEEEEDDE